MSTIKNQDYVSIESRKFIPTELGFLVTDLLTAHFPEIMSVDFTAALEAQLDSVEKDEEPWTDIVDRFYKPFEKRLLEAQKKITPQKPALTVIDGVKCPECEGPMVIRKGKKGKFLSCKSFPKCKGSMPYNKPGTKNNRGKEIATPVKCHECGAPLVLKTGRYGLFLTCSRFPKCRAKGPSATGLPCAREDCDGKLVLKRSKQRRTFFGCSNYPECTFTFTDVLIPDKCPACGFDYYGASLKKNIVSFICPRCNHKTVPEDKETNGNGEGNPKIPDISGS